MTIHPEDALHAANVACAFLLHSGQGLDGATLARLAYVADRRHLAKTGHPILDGRRRSTANGPVHVDTALLTDGRETSPEWDALVTVRDGSHIPTGGITEDALDRLSVSSAQTIRDVWEEYGASDGFTGSPMHPDFPEWQPLEGREISLRDMLEANGVAGDVAKTMSENLTLLEGLAKRLRPAQ